jgi:hypothetical protein
MLPVRHNHPTSTSISSEGSDAGDGLPVTADPEAAAGEEPDAAAAAAAEGDAVLEEDGIVWGG